MAYKLKNISKKITNYTVYGTVVNEMEVVDDLKERFAKAAANGVTEAEMIEKLAGDENLLFEEIKVKEKTEEVKPVKKLAHLKNDELVALCKEKDIELTGEEKRNDLLKLLKD